MLSLPLDISQNWLLQRTRTDTDISQNWLLQRTRTDTDISQNWLLQRTRTDTDIDNIQQFKILKYAIFFYTLTYF